MYEYDNIDYADACRDGCVISADSTALVLGDHTGQLRCRAVATHLRRLQAVLSGCVMPQTCLMDGELADDW